MSQDERLNILDTLARYQRYSADARYDDWADLFAENGEFIGIDEVPQSGHEALAKHIESKHPEPRGVTKNITANPIIEINGDMATAISDFVLVEISDQSSILLAGRYEDELRKEPSGWKFVLRRMVYAKQGK